MGKLIKDGAVIEVKLTGEEAEDFVTAYYAIHRMTEEGVIDLAEPFQSALGSVYDKIVNYINEHRLGSSQ